MNRKATIDDIAESIVYGLSESASGEPVGPKFLRITDIQDDSVDWDTVPYCKATQTDIEKSRIVPGDIVFARTGATTGKSFLVRSCPTESVFASYLIRLRLKSEVEARYVAHFFKSAGYWIQVNNLARGAGQPGINASVLKSVELPIPPLVDQRRIADILDRADALKRKRQQALQLADDFLRATFLDMFGDPSHNTFGWPLEPVSGLISEPMVYGTMQPGRQRGTHIVLRVANIAAGRLSHSTEKWVTLSSAEGRRYGVRKGDILLARAIGSESHLGKMALIEVDAESWAFDSHLMRVRFDDRKVLPLYVKMLFETHGGRTLFLRQAGRTAVQFNVNTRQLGRIHIPVPPIYLQCSFVKLAGLSESLRTICVGCARQVEDVARSLESKFFGGSSWTPLTTPSS